MKGETFHLYATIISVSRLSLISYLLKYSTGLFEVAKDGIVFTQEIFKSVLNWF